LNLKKSQQLSVAVAQELRRIRLEKGLSQLSVAQKAGISRAAVQHIESGLRNPTLIVIHSMASALEVSLSSLIHRLES